LQLPFLSRFLAPHSKTLFIQSALCTPAWPTYLPSFKLPWSAKSE
jgi:hypothetical protein